MLGLICWLLCAVFAVSFVFVFLSYFIFLYEWGNATDDVRKDVDPMTILFAFIKEIPATFIQFLGLPLGYFRWENLLKPAAARSSTPILFIHGYLLTPSVFLFWRYQMKRRNRGNTFALHLRPGTSPIEILAEGLMRKVDEVKRETGASKIVLIGHSLGGLVAHYYVEKLGGKESVDRLVAIATPYRGTKLAILGFGESCRQMRFQSRFVTQFFEPGMQSSVPVLACPVIPDNLLIPNDSAVPPFMSKTYALRAAGHLGCLLSIELLEAVLRFIDADVQPAPRPSATAPAVPAAPGGGGPA